MADPQTGRRAALSARRATPAGLILLWAAVLGLLFLALRGIPLTHIAETLGRLRAWQIALLALMNLAILWAMALRWWLLLRSLGEQVPLPAVLAYRLVGFSVSYFTPGPHMGGEPVQVHLLHRRGIPLPTAVSSVAIDRLVDLLGNLTFLVIGSLVLIMRVDQGGQAWLLSFGLLLFPLLHLFALRRGHRPVTWLASRLGAGRQSPRLQAIIAVAGQSEQQVGTLLRERPGALFQAVAVSAVVWVAVVAEFALTVRFLGVPAGLADAISALTAFRLSFLLPLPAGLGALEASLALAARWLGWDPAVGIAASLFIRARDVLLAGAGAGLGALAYRTLLFRPRLPKQRS